MTVGVLWEFFECAMDQFFFLDMQKDTVIPAISSVLLDPAGGNHPQLINGIRDVIIVYGDGTQQALGVGGYLDIGLLDTMEDLFVNFKMCIRDRSVSASCAKSTVNKSYWQ